MKDQEPDTRGGTMEICEGQDLPHRNSGDSSALLDEMKARRTECQATHPFPELPCLDCNLWTAAIAAMAATTGHSLILAALNESEDRRRRVTQERDELLAAAKSTVAFLNTIEWNEESTEDDGVNVQHALEVAIAKAEGR